MYRYRRRDCGTPTGIDDYATRNFSFGDHLAMCLLIFRCPSLQKTCSTHGIGYSYVNQHLYVECSHPEACADGAEEGIDTYSDGNYRVYFS